VGIAYITLILFVRASVIFGQQVDPSEIFLKAYLATQQGEKLEHQDRFKTALAKYRFAGSLIEELRKSYADWQPAVVEYRGRRVSEAILRLQERTVRQNQLDARASPLPEIAPVAPESDAWSEPGPEVVAPPANQTLTDTERDGALKGTTKKLRDKLAQLQTALDKTRGDLETARKEREVVDTRLRETNSKLERTQSDLDDIKKSERQAQVQLTELEETGRASQESEIRHDEEQQQSCEAIAQLKEALAAADQARVTAEKELDDTQARFAEANSHISALKRERDDSLSQLKSARQTEQDSQSLLAEKSDLQQKLASAEEKVGKLSESDPGASTRLAEMGHQMAQLQQKVNETENRNYYLAARAAELDVELEDTSAELQAAKLAEVNSEESAELTRENELLRNIVVRERQEEARREDARKLIVAELDRLKISSDLLHNEIEFLAQPVTTLSNEELALFRQPVVSISSEKPGVFKASFVFEKKSRTGVVDREKMDPTAIAAPKATVPNKLEDTARAAMKNVEQGKYRPAEKQFQQILAIDPSNLDALSNLGVVYFRTGKLRSAESTLKNYCSDRTQGLESNCLSTNCKIPPCR
jgi:hypothetical protein